MLTVAKIETYKRFAGDVEELLEERLSDSTADADALAILHELAAGN